jgi:hypothetical protein
MLPTLPDTLAVGGIDPDQVRHVTHAGSGKEIPFTTVEGKLSLETTGITEQDLAHVFRIRLKN